MKRVALLSPFLLAALLLLYAETAFSAVVSAFNLWATRVLPALFPFYFVTTRMAHTDAFGTLHRFFERRSGAKTHLFSALLCFLYGAVAGYPSGARAAKQTGYPQYTAYCNLCSPAFLLGVPALSLLGDRRAFFSIAIAHYGSALLFLLVRIAFSRGEEAPVCDAPNKPSNAGVAADMSESMIGMMKICGCIIAFSVATDVGAKLLFGKTEGALYAAFACFLEMTNGCAAIASLHLPLRLQCACMSAAVTFGGLCVYAQTVAVTEKRLPVRYLISKLAQAVAAFWLAYWLAPLFWQGAVQTGVIIDQPYLLNAFDLAAILSASCIGALTIYLIAMIIKKAEGGVSRISSAS